MTTIDFLQSSRTEASPSDPVYCHFGWGGNSYSSAEMQLAFSTTQADWPCMYVYECVRVYVVEIGTNNESEKQ